MYRLADLRDGRSRWRAVALALGLFAASLFAVVGVVAATASLVAGFGLRKAFALRFAVVFGGGLLLAGHLALARPTARNRPRTLAGAGTSLGVAGLALFWTNLPAGWTGSLAELPTVALGTYVAGLLAVFGGGLAAPSSEGDERADSDEAFTVVESPVTARPDDDSDAAKSSAVVGERRSDETENSAVEKRT